MAFLLILAAAACAEMARVQFVMGAPLEIRSESAPAIEAAFAEVRRWDALLSTYKKESELSRLNAKAGQGPVKVSAELWAALTLADRFVGETGGAFDPCAPCGARWDKAVRLDARKRTVALSSGAAVDPGAFGKGLALDEAARAMKAQGAKTALLNFAGQVLVLGGPFEVLPAGRYERLSLSNASAATSGDYEKPGHIVSPFTGGAVRRQGDYTAVFPSAAQADAWSTALYVLGKIPAGFSGCALIPERKPSQGCKRFLLLSHTKGDSR